MWQDWERVLRIVKFTILHVPHLTYCQTVWHFCRSSDARKLERIQERALRAVYCDNNSTYEELLKRAKLPTLHTRRLQVIAIIMYKVKSGLTPPYITDLFVVTSSQYHLRNSDFTIPRSRTVACGKHSLTHKCTYISFLLIITYILLKEIPFYLLCVTQQQLRKPNTKYQKKNQKKHHSLEFVVLDEFYRV